MKGLLKIQLANYVADFTSMPPTPAAPVPEKPVLTDNQKQVFIESEKAWKAYSESPEGKKELAEVENMDLPTLRAYVASLPDKPIFIKLISWIRSLDLPDSSFTIGITVEAELIIGFSGTIGIATGIGESKGLEAAEFLTVAVDVGLQAGAMIGVQFGLWNEAPADLGGSLQGVEIDLGAEVEFSAGFYFNTSGRRGIAITLGAGIEDGISIVEYYTYILGDQGVDPYLKPVVQPRKKNFLILESLKCVHPSNDGSGDENEVYFTFQADGDTVYPYPTYSNFSMKEGESWACGRSVWFNSSVAVTVYDEDAGNDDDVVGYFSIVLSQLKLNESVIFNSTKDYSSGLDNVEYTMKVRLIAQNVA